MGWRAAPPRRVGIFRALQLGDLLCAVPALRALRRAWPAAEIHLIGLPWARDLARHLTSYIDAFHEFPGLAGLPEREPDAAGMQPFLQGMRQQRFDLLVQLHGSGTVVNGLLDEFGAVERAGFVPADAPRLPPLHCRWPTSGTEVERLLGVIDALGLPRAGMALEFAVTAADRGAAARLVGAARPLALVHPGAQLPSRRWSPARFAAVADALAARGHRVALTGTAAEAGLTARVRALARTALLDLAGRSDLGTFAALIEAARLVVCNDTGTSHLAAALGTPSVVVSSGGDAARWAPADAARHRVLWHDVACRPCAHRECPYAHGCADGVSVGAVVAAVDALQSACM